MDENGGLGHYEITRRVDLGNDGSRDGQVFVDNYYDKETGRAIAPGEFQQTPGYELPGQ